MNTTTLNKKQRQALDLLARGGARYGTRIDVMKQLASMGLCYAHDKGTKGKSRWTWRPTPQGCAVIASLKGTQ